MSKITGGPAFPIKEFSKDLQSIATYHVGMTLRDYFAAKAMQGMMTDVTYPRGDAIAMWAYEVADAMLEAREQ